MSDAGPASVCHVLPYLAAAYGGPVFAAAGMARAVASRGWRVCVAGLLSPGECPAELFGDVPVQTFGDSRLGSWRYSRGLRRYLAHVEADVFHSHGLWTDVHWAVGSAARRRGIPHVIGPCGMLNPEAMLRSRWRKRLVWWSFERAALRRAACLVGNSQSELDDLDRLRLNRCLALVPNPIMPPAKDVGPVGQGLWPGMGGRPAVLYLGRLHPVKGAMRLIEAWDEMGDSGRQDWVLVVAGPDEGGYRAALEAKVATLPCAPTVCFTGPLDHRRKWQALSAAELFVLPSDFENFGMSAAEAMLAGLPVIATTGTPWEALRVHGAGWWVEPTPSALAQAIAAAARLSPAVRRRMGEQGRRLAAAFTPEAVGARLGELYSWLLGAGECPSCVQAQQA